MRSVRWAGFAAASIVFSTSVAFAAPSEAQKLFTEGRAAMTKNDFETACTKFAESFKLEEAPGTMLNLGDCEEKRGHLVAAEQNYRKAASGFTAAPKQQFANEQADRVAQRVPKYVVHGSNITGLVVKEGETPIALDTPTPHDAGELTLHAEAPGRKPKELKATLTENNQSTIDVGELEPEAATTTAVTPPKPESSGMSTMSTVGIIVGAVGVASLATGAITGVMALGRASTVKDHCNDALACDPQGVDAADSGSTLSLISTITVIAGAALAVGGGTMFVLGRKKKETGSSSKTLILPSASPTFAGFFLTRHF